MKLRIFLHIALFLLFLALPLLFTPLGLSFFDELEHNPNERSKVLVFCLMYVLFYIHYFILIPRLFFTKRYVLYGFITITAFVFIVLFSKSIPWFNKMPPPQYHGNNMPPFEDRAFDYMPPPPYGNKKGNMPPPNTPIFISSPVLSFDFKQELFLFLIGIFITLALRINQKWQKSEHDKLNAELAYLKTQINPHFLFNTLNSLFAFALDENAPKTADALVKLANMMRYTANEAAKDFVPLDKEIEQITHYIDLQKMRYSETLKVNYEVSGDFKNKRIAPMILITFVENAFKYGINTEEECPIDIKIGVLNNQLQFAVFNKKYSKKGIESMGLGLDNTRHRLNGIYQNNHQLFITDNQNDYAVSLQMTLI